MGITWANRVRRMNNTDGRFTEPIPGPLHQNHPDYPVLLVSIILVTSGPDADMTSVTGSQKPVRCESVCSPGSPGLLVPTEGIGCNLRCHPVQMCSQHW